MSSCAACAASIDDLSTEEICFGEAAEVGGRRLDIACPLLASDSLPATHPQRAQATLLPGSLVLAPLSCDAFARIRQSMKRIGSMLEIITGCLLHHFHSNCSSHFSDLPTL
jgi:hypothetical protein